QTHIRKEKQKTVYSFVFFLFVVFTLVLQTFFSIFFYFFGLYLLHSFTYKYHSFIPFIDIYSLPFLFLFTKNYEPPQPTTQPTRSTSLRPSASSSTNTTTARSSASPMFPTPTPSRSTPQSLEQLLQLKLDIGQQLDEKQQLHQTCESGIQKNVLARQIGQLQTKLSDLDLQLKQQEDSPLDTTDKRRHLERDFLSHRGQQRKDKPYPQKGLGVLSSPSTSNVLSAAGAIPSSSSLLPLPPPPSGSTPTKRRSKVPNNDRRNTDIEFATEIGQGLLIEVRKMQAILQEKEEQLRALEIQKTDLERSAEAMAKQLRQREENEEKLKEETWNLELTKQELTLSVTELQQHLQKATNEQTKLAKQTSDLRSDIEQLRDREEKLTASLETSKQRHEQDMSAMRRHCAGLQRESQQHAKHIDTLTSELAIAKAQSRLGKHHTSPSNVGSNHGELSSDEGTDPSHSNLDPSSIHHHHHHRSGSPTVSSIPPSPKQSPASAMEVETLKTSLAHAHRMVSNLRSNLHKEKTEKFEFKKLLAESQETIEQLQNDPHLWVDAPSLSSSANHGGLANGSLDDQKKRKVKQHRRTIRKPHRGGSSGGLGGNMATLATATSKSGSRKYRNGMDSSENNSDDFYSYSSASSDDDDDEHDSVPPPPGFTSLSLELSQSTAKFENVSCEMGVMTDMESTVVLDGHHYEQQLDRLQQLESWYQASLDKSTQWTESTLVCMNQDPVTLCETTTQTHKVTPVDMALQTTEPESVHQECQCDLPNLGEATIETLAIAPTAFANSSPTESSPILIGVDQGVQCRNINPSQKLEMATQVDPILVTDASTQFDNVSVNSAVQHEYSSVDQHTQYDIIGTETKDSATQHEMKSISKDVSTQSDRLETMTATAVAASTATLGKSVMVDAGCDPIIFDTCSNGSTNVAIQAVSPVVKLSNGGLHGEWFENTRSTNDAKVQHDGTNMAPMTLGTTTSANLDGDYSWLGSFNEIETGTTPSVDRSTKDTSSKLYSQEEMDETVSKAVEAAITKHKLANEKMLDQQSSMVPTRPTQPPPSALLDKATKNSSVITFAAASTMDFNNSNGQLGWQSSISNTNNRTPSHSTTNAVHPAVIVSSSESDKAPSIASSTHDDDDDEEVTSVLPPPTTTADPTISSITQTMIGEWLTKYTRKHMGVQERQHERYFWVHPYTRTLYWCTRTPGADGGELKAKSAFVESVTVANDDSPDGDGGVPCLLIQTLTRQLKIKAPTKERHDLWLEVRKK
ncbi:hypothetical protein BCR42DRAFT_114024, partial [Absidia repens]